MKPIVLTMSTVICLGLAGCGQSSGDPAASTSGSSTSQAAGSGGYPVTVDNCGRKQTFTQRPSRVVILNGTSVGEVESFILMGLEKSILANAQHYGISDDPTMIAKIDALPKGGLTMNKNFDVPAEQLMALKPDLVVSTWAGGFDKDSGFATRDELESAGIRTIVNPVNCAFGAAHPTPAQQATLKKAGINSSFEFLSLLGTIFGETKRADGLVATMRSRIAGVRKAVAGQPTPTAMIAYPGMSMMNSAALPAVMTGGIYDDVLAAAGTRNVFAGKPMEFTRTMSGEQLAAANPEILIIGGFTPGEDLDKEAAALFKQYPNWPAAKNKRYVKTSDGVYLGPLNSIAIAKIATVAHPGRVPAAK